MIQYPDLHFKVTESTSKLLMANLIQRYFLFQTKFGFIQIDTWLYRTLKYRNSYVTQNFPLCNVKVGGWYSQRADDYWSCVICKDS
jgi:hypothetical protein